MELEGRLTRLDFVNPHSYVYFDVVGNDSKVIAMKCEMRSATVLRRSGWSPEMFVPGASIKVTGHPHRDDPTACYCGDDDAWQCADARALSAAERREIGQSHDNDLSGCRTASRTSLATGRRSNRSWPRRPAGAPGSCRSARPPPIRAGKLPMPAGPAGWFPPPVKLTAAGQAAAEALRKRPTSENPRLSCQITSILFDWVFDGAINRITQSATVIKMEYGVGLTRTVHLNMTAHPANIDAEPRRSFDRPLGRRYARRRHGRLRARQPGRLTPPQQQTARRRALHAESRNARAHPRHRRRTIPSTSRTSTWIPIVSCRRMRRSGSRPARSSRRSISKPGGSEADCRCCFVVHFRVGVSEGWYGYEVAALIVMPDTFVSRLGTASAFRARSEDARVVESPQHRHHPRR